MERGTDETTPQEAESTLQLKRPLLPIDEYAAREGVSTRIVEECGKLGVLQIRRFRGKTFVVDVPLSPYTDLSEAANELTQPLDEAAHAKKIAELAQKLAPDTPETDSVPEKLIEQVKAGTISRLVKKMFRKFTEMTNKLTETTHDKTARTENAPGQEQTSHPETHQTSEQQYQFTDDLDLGLDEDVFESLQIVPPEPLKIIDDPEEIDDLIDLPKDIPEPDRTTPLEPINIFDEPAESADEITLAENSSEPFKPPDLETLEAANEFPDFFEDNIEAEETPEPSHLPKDERFLFGLLTARASSKLFWQVTALLSLALLFAALFVNLWFYMDGKIQGDRLDLAYASIQKISADFTQAGQEAQNIRNRLAESRAENARIQNELERSSAEVRNLRNEIARVRKDLETLQQQNAEAVEQLNKQIQNFTARINDLTKKR